MNSALVAWLNGQFLPLSEASLSVHDAGVTGGVTVTERLRTFRHAPFLLNEHLDRLAASADAAYVPLQMPIDRIATLVDEVVDLNRRLLPSDEDLSIAVFATAGVETRPTLCIHASPLPAKHYAAYYEAGLRLVTPSTHAIPADSISPQIKARSRLHWHIADAQAQRFDDGAKALLLDRDGFVTETATGNLFVVDQNRERIRTPRRTRTLHGISQAFVIERHPEIEESDLCMEDLTTADELFVTSSVSCLMPVVSLNRMPIGNGRPGPVSRALLAEWSEVVGVNIAGQMVRMASAQRQT